MKIRGNSIEHGELVTESFDSTLTNGFLYSDKVEKKSATGKPTCRHSLFVETALVEDSLFPFKAGKNMIARIDNDMLIITNDKGVDSTAN
jgi:hypothetical protein